MLFRSRVDGVAGWRVDLAGTGPDAKRTVGVMVERGGAAWFFKLVGSREAVKKQVVAFDKFVQNVKWKP